jgi:hypothetical protein
MLGACLSLVGVGCVFLADLFHLGDLDESLQGRMDGPRDEDYNVLEGSNSSSGVAENSTHKFSPFVQPTPSNPSQR